MIACYFTNWTVYRKGNGQFKVEHIDPQLCTHIFYAFEGVQADGTFRIIDEWGDINLSKYLQSKYFSFTIRNGNSLCDFNKNFLFRAN